MKKLLTVLLIVLTLVGLAMLFPQRGLRAAGTSHSIVLTWNASPSATQYPTGSDYAIFRASSDGGENTATPYTTVPTGTTTFTDTSVTLNAKYYYTVAFCVEATCSAMSNEANAIVPLSPGDLVPPAGLAAKAN